MHMRAGLRVGKLTDSRPTPLARTCYLRVRLSPSTTIVAHHELASGDSPAHHRSPACTRSVSPPFFQPRSRRLRCVEGPARGLRPALSTVPRLLHLSYDILRAFTSTRPAARVLSLHASSTPKKMPVNAFLCLGNGARALPLAPYHAAGPCRLR